MNIHPPSGPRPVAFGAIEDELETLRQTLPTARIRPGCTPAMRPLLASIAAIGGTAQESAAFQEVFSSLAGCLPCRLITVSLEPERLPTALEAEVAVLCQPGASTVECMCCDLINLRLHGTRTADLPALASRLWAPDVPVVLWWPRAALKSPIFTALAGQAERLIVDSAVIGAAGLPALAAYAARPRSGRPDLSDLAWIRLTPIRHAMAQFFDSPDACLCLAQAHSLRIKAAPGAAQLLAGWLQTRVLCSGQAIQPRHIELSVPGQSSALFQEIHLTCTADSARFSIVQEDFGQARMCALLSGQIWERLITLDTPSTAELLAAETASHGPDQVYEEALTAAALLPAL